MRQLDHPTVNFFERFFVRDRLTDCCTAAILGRSLEKESVVFPFVYAPTYEYPLSGDVSQRIAPDFGLDIEGIPEVEHEVVTTVASFGKQLGKLTDAVLALADKAQMLDAEEIVELKKIADGVEAAKSRAKEAAEARAERMRNRADKLAGL